MLSEKVFYFTFKLFYRHMSACVGLCRHVSACVGMCRHVLARVGTCRHVSARVGTCRHVLARIGTCRHVLFTSHIQNGMMRQHLLIFYLKPTNLFTYKTFVSLKIFGAPISIMTVARIVAILKVQSKNRSMTAAANFQSLVILSSSSWALILSVINFKSFWIDLILISHLGWQGGFCRVASSWS